MTLLKEQTFKSEHLQLSSTKKHQHSCALPMSSTSRIPASSSPRSRNATHIPRREAPLPTPRSPSSAVNGSRNARFFAQLLKDYHHSTIQVTPSELKHMTRDKGLRDVRRSGVHELKLAIKRSGWARTPLIASGKDDGLSPRLLEGFHRAEALFQLFNEKDTGWLLRNETPETFRVEVTVLKGLTAEQEQQISRESNLVNSSNVVMSLVDHVVAMRSALQTCLDEENLDRLVEVSRKVLFKHHPDYQHYAKSSVSLWKRLATKLGVLAWTYMKKQQWTPLSCFLEKNTAT